MFYNMFSSRSEETSLLSREVYGHVCLKATSHKGEKMKRSSDTTDRSFTPRVHFLLSVEALTMLCFCVELELRARDNRTLLNLDRTGSASGLIAEERKLHHAIIMR